MELPSLVPGRLVGHARNRPGQIAFRQVERSGGEADDLSWGDLWNRARATAERLLRETAEGARVGIACTHTLDYAVALAACLVAGRVAVPLPAALSRRSAPRAQAVIHAAGPEVLLVSGGDTPPDWLDLEAGVRACGVAGADAPEAPPKLPAASPDRDSIALIQFSSGSTGHPKGIALTHGNLAANCRSITTAFDLGESTCQFSWLPLHHDMGLIGHVVLPLWLGCRSVLGNPLRFLQRPLSWIQFMSEQQATLTSAPNFAFELAARAADEAGTEGIDLTRLTTVICGGEQVQRRTMERFLSTFGPVGLSPNDLCPCYGLAEATLLVSSGRLPTGPLFVPQPATDREASTAAVAEAADLGPPVDSVHLRIADADCRTAAEGTVGEVMISGPAVGRMLDRTGQAVSAPEIATGDLGFLLGGRIHIGGRIKDIIIVRGQNLAAVDAEEAALHAHPDLMPGGIAALGVGHDGTEDLVIVAEVRKRNALKMLPRAIAKAVSAETGVAPERVILSPVGALPRTPSGKIRRHVARQMLAEGTLRQLDTIPGKEKEGADAAT